MHPNWVHNALWPTSFTLNYCSNDGKVFHPLLHKQGQKDHPQGHWFNTVNIICIQATEVSMVFLPTVSTPLLLVLLLPPRCMHSHFYGIRQFPRDINKTTLETKDNFFPQTSPLHSSSIGNLHVDLMDEGMNIMRD